MARKFSPRKARRQWKLETNARRIGLSLVSLSALAWALDAHADTTISTARTTPVNTATANNGAPDNVVIDSAGSVKPTTAGAAVTLDSNNTVSNSGVIETQDVSGTTGILVLGGHTGSVSNLGSIIENETATATDTNGDGNLDGPFATGSGRFGIHVTGPGTFTGAISNTSVITVQGNDSAGISVETDLAGGISNPGSVNVTGSRVYGIRTTGAVSGDITALGAITVQGEGAKALSVEGDVAGGVIVQNVVTASGYRYTTRSTDTTFLSKLGADDLLQGGPAISITANVGHGLLVDAPPPDLDPNNADEDGDGIPDASETTGAVSSNGAAPAIVAGAVGRDLALGNVGTGDSAYGVFIRGSVTGVGVYDGIAATGLQLGVAGGGAVTTGGGVRNTGTVASLAYAADSTALRVMAGAQAPVIQNEGRIAATSNSAGGFTATAVDIEAGATVPLFRNIGVLQAQINGASGDAVAIRDASGTLAEISNTNQIATAITPTTAGGAVTGRTIAVDVSANTTGVHLAQAQKTGSTAAPSIKGDILFGSGADRMEVLAGTVTGDVAFGAGANALTLDGGAAMTGRLTADGGTLALSVGTGALDIVNVGVVNLTSLSLASGSQLVLTADPASGQATRFEVAGAADIASGAKIGLRLTSVQAASQTYTLIHASQLTAGAIDSSLLGAIPYLYTSSLSTNAAAGTVDITLARKTAAALALPTTTAGAYEPILAAVGRDADLQSALLARTDRASFIRMYNQMLPNHSGGVFQLAATATEAFGRAIDDRQAPQSGGFWAQEVNYGLTADSQGEDPGYRAWGFGLTGGYELKATPVGTFGVTLAGGSGQLRTSGAISGQALTTDVFEAGGYWRQTWGRLSADARVAGDYLRMGGDRTIVSSDAKGAQVARTASGHWSGTGLVGHVRVAYEQPLVSSIYLRPQLSLDYFRLAEGGYGEYGGGEAVDLTVDSRTSSRLSGFAGLALGALFDGENPWGPELLVGWRDVANETLGPTTARFTAGGDAFSLASDALSGQGIAAHFSIRSENGYGGFAVETGAETRDSLFTWDFRVAAHFQF